MSLLDEDSKFMHANPLWVGQGFPPPPPLLLLLFFESCIFLIHVFIWFQASVNLMLKTVGCLVHLRRALGQVVAARSSVGTVDKEEEGRNQTKSYLSVTD